MVSIASRDKVFQTINALDTGRLEELRTMNDEKNKYIREQLDKLKMIEYLEYILNSPCPQSLPIAYLHFIKNCNDFFFLE